MFQVQRLDSAIREENKQSADANDGLVGNKRPRDSEDEDPNGSDKIKAIDKFRGMGVRQLREEAARRGVSATGSKGELLERLCGNTDMEVKGIDEEGMLLHFLFVQIFFQGMFGS